MEKVFLGGTCISPDYRSVLIPILKINFFNPVVPNWNEEAQKKELIEREICDYCLYCITPQMKGVYSIAEVIDDSNKRPDKVIFCPLEQWDGIWFDTAQWKSMKAVAGMVERNGGKVFYSLNEVANFLNNIGNKNDNKSIS